ncbi:MAG: hypothetical protein KAU60_12865, partial [Desulfobacterales bacterium]|nr:hypothetical protein [Desulfobacterales bacterium]
LITVWGNSPLPPLEARQFHPLPGVNPKPAPLGSDIYCGSIKNQIFRHPQLQPLSNRPVK